MDQIYAEINGQQRGATLTQLSSQYYTNIPHAASRAAAPPVLKTMEQYHAKKEVSQLLRDMLLVSSDESSGGNVLFEDDVDAKYHALGTELTAVEKVRERERASES